ncbi:MAG: hypothetical protein HOQ33_10085 [Cupriavidus sp.]|nr:hypothetical protein [Cupriavidus sp.]
MLLHSTRPWLAAGTITLALMLAACGGGDAPGTGGGTLQPGAANGNAPDASGKPGHTGKPGTCASRCAP